jgi:hypothetical protein
MIRNLLARLKRLEDAPDPGPAGGMPPDWWSFLAREPLPATAIAECRAWARAHWPKGPSPSRTGAVEARIQAALAARANERPHLPAGLKEIGGPPWTSTN